MAARGEPGDAACGEALSAGPRRFRSRSSPARQSLLICASQSCCSQPSFIGVTVALGNCASPGSRADKHGGRRWSSDSIEFIPAVGLARVGDAERSTNDFFFVGPEAPGVPPNFNSQSGSFDSFKLDGRVRPQAARFRIFEYEKGADGKFHPKVRWRSATGARQRSPGRSISPTGTPASANQRAGGRPCQPLVREILRQANAQPRRCRGGQPSEHA